MASSSTGAPCLVRGELPLAEGFHGVGVEPARLCRAPLDAVDRAVAANHGVEDDFRLRHVFELRLGGYFGSIFLRGPGAENVRGGQPRAVEFARSSEKFRIQLPVGAVEVGHVDEHLVDLFSRRRSAPACAAGRPRNSEVRSSRVHHRSSCADRAW